jgi:uncharacterized protein (DUF1501 family)
LPIAIYPVGMRPRRTPLGRGADRGGADRERGDQKTAERELRPTWKDTVIVAITEFGRTARINGTQRTDRGTGTIMLLAGGAVRGGRVIADWPGLRQNQLRDCRDLAATTIAVDLLGSSPALLSRDVFPGSEAAAPMKGLIV